MKRILPFILIILSVFGLAHYFIYQIVSRSIHTADANFTFIVVLFVGLISMPAGFFISKTRNEKLYFISWIGFIWMGLFNFLFFTITDFKTLAKIEVVSNFASYNVDDP